MNSLFTSIALKKIKREDYPSQCTGIIYVILSTSLFINPMYCKYLLPVYGIFILFMESFSQRSFMCSNVSFFSLVVKRISLS